MPDQGPEIVLDEKNHLVGICSEDTTPTYLKYHRAALLRDLPNLHKITPANASHLLSPSGLVEAALALEDFDELDLLSLKPAGGNTQIVNREYSFTDKGRQAADALQLFAID